VGDFPVEELTLAVDRNAHSLPSVDEDGMSPQITFRSITAADEEFLYQVYASTRAEELAQVAWSVEQKESFLRMQFRAQQQYYQSTFSGAQFEIICQQGEPAGRLYVARLAGEIRIIDIALLPQHRGRGIGSRLSNELLDEARLAGKPVRIHVERFNPALRLYERLGFHAIEDKGIYLLLERPPMTG